MYWMYWYFSNQAKGQLLRTMPPKVTRFWFWMSDMSGLGVSGQLQLQTHFAVLVWAPGGWTVHTVPWRRMLTLACWGAGLCLHLRSLLLINDDPRRSNQKTNNGYLWQPCSFSYPHVPLFSQCFFSMFFLASFSIHEPFWAHRHGGLLGGLCDQAVSRGHLKMGFYHWNGNFGLYHSYFWTNPKCLKTRHFSWRFGMIWASFQLSW